MKEHEVKKIFSSLLRENNIIEIPLEINSRLRSVLAQTIFIKGGFSTFKIDISKNILNMVLMKKL
jgi:hypothetical protein